MTGESKVAPVAEELENARQSIQQLLDTLGGAIVGQERLLVGVVVGLLARGNVLLEGQPGLGKTLLVKLLAQALQLDFSRVQFTPDLMPADITGTQALVSAADGSNQLVFRKGPLFANIVLADEINRATPKTQSALLEAMQEQGVTVAGRRHLLPAPFAVIATQNPIEMEGTYPLPEAQLDRFMMKLSVSFPDVEALAEIAMRTTGTETLSVKQVMDGPALKTLQEQVRGVIVDPLLARRAAELVAATHPGNQNASPAIARFVKYGASPRAVQALVLAGRANALMAGRAFVTAEDLFAFAQEILAHRLVLGFEAELEGVTSEELVKTVVESMT